MRVAFRLLRRFFLRFFRRLRHAFRWKEIWRWDFESCQRCGSCYKICVNWSDKFWWKIRGTDSGTLCPECTITISQENMITLHSDYIESMYIFNTKFGCLNLKEFNQKNEN